MMHELPGALLRQAVFLSGVILLVLAARRPLRRLFGCEAAYALWMTVPLALAAALLPGLPAPAPVAAAMAPVRALGGYVQPLPASQQPGWSALLLALWLAGCLVFLASAWRAHRRYHRGLGRLEVRGAHLYFENAAHGPAVVGVWRPVILLPPDFEQRYGPAERALILAHEGVHVCRRDPLANALCALVQCAFWFNPLVHAGARRFRLDQELACDAAVMREHRGMEHSYAQAMLKTQLSSQAALVHCHWRSVHPLKERVMELKQTPPQGLRRLAGQLVAGLLAALGAGAALVAHAGPGVLQPGLYRVEMQLSGSGMAASPTMLVEAGKPFAVAKGDGDNTWRGDFVLDRVDGQNVFVKSVIKHNDRVTGNPSLRVALGEPATIRVQREAGGGELRLELKITEAPPQ